MKIYVLTLYPCTYDYDREFLYVGPDKQKVIDYIEGTQFMRSWEVTVWQDGQEVDAASFNSLEKLKKI